MQSLVLNSVRFKIDNMSLCSNVQEIISKFDKEKVLTILHEADKIKSLVRNSPALKILTSKVLLECNKKLNTK